MGDVAERWKIEAVLSLVRAASFERFHVAGSNDPDSKTRAFLRSIEYRDIDVYRTVRGLELVDYSRGPLRDDKGRPRDLWVFGRYVKEYEVYIKLAVYLSKNEVRAVCVSFHEAQWPLAYPYKKAS